MLNFIAPNRSHYLVITQEEALRDVPNNGCEVDQVKHNEKYISNQSVTDKLLGKIIPSSPNNSSAISSVVVLGEKDGDVEVNIRMFILFQGA